MILKKIIIGLMSVLILTFSGVAFASYSGGYSQYSPDIYQWYQDVDAGGYDLENVEDLEVIGTLTASSIATPYQSIVTVAVAGADYNTIQAALDANTVPVLIRVAPGTYTDDTINFTADNQTVRGMGLTAKQLVTTADANIVDFGAYTNCRIENMKLKMTAPTTNAKDIITGSGSLRLRWCHLELTNSTVTGSDQPSCLNTTGNVAMVLGTIKYTNSVSDATAIKVPIQVGTAAAIELRRVNIDVDGSGAGLTSALGWGTSTGVLDIYRCNIDVLDDEATYTVGTFYILGTGCHEVRGCDIHVANSTATAAAIFLAGGSPSIRSMFNHFHVTSAGGTANSFIIGAGDTVVSQLDDIVAADGVSNSGTYTHVNSENDGYFELTGQITSTLADGTAPLVLTSTTKVINLNADLLDGYDWDDGQDVVFGSVQAAYIPTATKTATYAVTTADLGKSIRMNSGGTVTFTLPSVGAAEDGALLRFVKCAVGRLNLVAADSDKIADSGAGGTIYNDVAAQTYADISLEYVHLIVTWIIPGAHGTWTTTN